MLTSIPPILNAAHMGVNSRSCFGVISNRAFSEKIKQIAIACFKACTSLYFGTFGTTELIQGTHKKIVSSDNYSNKTEALKSSKAFLNLHGSLMLGCCSLTLIDALHAFGVIAMGSMATILSNAGSVLFLCANVFALEENIRLWNVLKDTDWSCTNITEKELAWTKQSTFWGALSNIGYILATASLLFSGVTAWTLIIAILSCFAGGVKMLCDLLIWAKTQQLF